MSCKYLGIFAIFLLNSQFSFQLEAANVVFVGDVDGDELGDGANALYAAADVSMINHLTNVLGHTVTSVDDSLTTAVAVAGADFIVVSATASSGTYANNNSGDGNSGATNSLGTDATILLMESGTNVVIPFELAGGSFGTHIGTDIQILELDGYLTNGFAVGMISIYDDPEFGGEEIRGFAARPPNGANAGFPQFDWTGNSLIGIAPIPFEPVVLGTHRIGDNLIVALPFGNAGFDHLTADGLQLFNNAFSLPNLDADYNGDGITDAADYVAYRKNPGVFGGDPGYGAWRTDFGTPDGGGAATGVPEPCTILLLIVGMGSIRSWRLARNVSPRLVITN